MGYASSAMCRFLLIHQTGTPSQPPPELLAAFAAMCQARSAQGEWQGDGWGIASLTTGQGWTVHKSLRPIWEDVPQLLAAPPAQAYAVHARGASLDKGRGNLAFNQPYVDGGCAFTFNGFLRGVSLPQRVPGEIGAQRIWNLVRQEMALRGASPATALDSVARMLEMHTREMTACNLGLINARGIYARCQYNAEGDYYQLRSHSSARLRLVSSEPLPSYDFVVIPQGRAAIV
jgi:predicted glutamine amidotransferase